MANGQTHRFIFTDSDLEVPVQENSHRIIIQYFSSHSAKQANEVCAEFQRLYKQFVVQAVQSSDRSLNSLDFFFIPCGGTRQRLSSVLSLKTSDDGNNKFGWDATNVLRELDRIIAKFLPPNLFIRVHQVDLDIYDADTVSVKLSVGQLEHTTPVRNNTSCTSWNAEEATFGFYTPNPLTQGLVATVIFERGDAQTNVRFEVPTDGLTMHRTKMVTVIPVHEKKMKVRLVLRAVGMPFPRTAPIRDHEEREPSSPTSPKRANSPNKALALTLKSPTAALPKPPPVATLNKSSSVEVACANILNNASLPSLVDIGHTGFNLSEEAMSEIFNHIDKDGSGYITKDEFRTLYASFENYGISESEGEIDRLLKRYNFMGDDVLSFDEFCLLVYKIVQR